MNTSTSGKFRAITLLVSGMLALSAGAALVPVTNVSTQPNTFECYLTATRVNVTLGTNSNVQAMIYQDTAPGAAPLVTTNGIPVPLIRLQVGQMFICHFANNLPVGSMDSYASLHWHGIELDADSDGTAVTQDAVRPGQTYVYQFKTFRPGLFWFHNHMDPGSSTYAGMYGVMIIPNNNEQSLINGNILPAANYTYPLALSDIDYNHSNGFVGKFLPSVTNWFTINELATMCHNGNQNNACGVVGQPGKTVLVNGATPNTNTANLSPLYVVPSGQRVRLQLMNEAIGRDFRLTLRYPTNNPNGDTNLYRIGGQGGLLNNIRLEGGVRGTWDTTFGLGEIVIGSGERADVLVYPTGTNGDIVKLVGNGLPAPVFQLTGAVATNYPIAYFLISNTASYVRPASNDAILATSTPVEDLKGYTTLNALTKVPPGLVGMTNRLLSLGNGGNGSGVANVDGIDAHALDMNLGNGDFTNGVPTNAPSTRYARVGDLLELSVSNSTSSGVHPWHLHGFSMQPVRMMTGAVTNYNYDYNEFLDTIEVYPGMTLVFRVRLDYRDKFCDLSPNASGTNGPFLMPCTNSVGGGAVGRWLFHCHIFLHAGVGMIGELDVLDPLQQTNYAQIPDLTTNGVDVLATTNTGSQMVADDFQCITNGPITGVSIWGSWLNDLVDTNAKFQLKIWGDVPAAGGKPSRPGWQTWQMSFPAGSYTATLASSNTLEPFYDPSTGLKGTNSQVYRYDFIIPEGQAFSQQSSNVYWLSVSAYSTNRFGWHSCLISANFNDAAEWSTSIFGPNWSMLQTNTINQGQPVNESFQLTTPATSINTTASPLLVSSPPPVLPPVLSTTMSDGNINIAWPGGGVLQSADQITGPWSDVDGATSPYQVPTDAPQRFYRVVIP